MFGTSLKLCCCWLAIRGCDCQLNYNFLIVAVLFQVGSQFGKQIFSFFFLTVSDQKFQEYVSFNAILPQALILIKPVELTKKDRREH